MRKSSFFENLFPLHEHKHSHQVIVFLSDILHQEMIKWFIKKKKYCNMLFYLLLIKIKMVKMI